MKTIGATCGLLMALSAFGAAQDIQTKVNGRLIAFPDVEPMMINNRVMVPLRGVFEEMGAQVGWNAYNNTVTAVKGADRITMMVGETYAHVNGKPVGLDSPAILVRNRVMVPLRFVSESIGAQVDWNPTLLLASITTDYYDSGNTGSNTGGATYAMFESGSVIPFTLNRKLSSNESMKGDKFTATLDTDGSTQYAGLPIGTKVLGHVAIAQPKTNESPGVLGLEFDQIMTPDGKLYNVQGSLIGLDNNSVEMKDGKLMAKNDAKRDLKYVGIGAGAGTLIAIATKENVLTSALLGAALGFLYDEFVRNPSRARDVTLNTGSEIGLRLDQAVRIDVAAIRR